MLWAISRSYCESTWWRKALHAHTSFVSKPVVFRKYHRYSSDGKLVNHVSQLNNISVFKLNKNSFASLLILPLKPILYMFCTTKKMLTHFCSISCPSCYYKYQLRISSLSSPNLNQIFRGYLKIKTVLSSYLFGVDRSFGVLSFLKSWYVSLCVSTQTSTILCAVQETVMFINSR